MVEEKEKQMTSNFQETREMSHTVQQPLCVTSWAGGSLRSESREKGWSERIHRHSLWRTTHSRPSVSLTLNYQEVFLWLTLCLVIFTINSDGGGRHSGKEWQKFMSSFPEEHLWLSPKGRGLVGVGLSVQRGDTSATSHPDTFSKRNRGMLNEEQELGPLWRQGQSHAAAQGTRQRHARNTWLCNLPKHNQEVSQC